MKKIKWMLLISLTALLAVACNETWDEHYSNKDGVNRSELLRLGDFIESKPEWSTFSELLKKTGYDTILNASQTYTVWVPDNDALKDVDQSDVDMLTKLVQSHISQLFITTSKLESERVYAISKKFNKFEKSETGFTYGGKKVKSYDILANNGIVHELEAYVPYIPNIWEFIQLHKESGLDSIYAYINSSFIETFDPVGSTEIDRDSLGNIIYDSSFVTENRVFNSLGNIDDEDSLYSLLLPTNTTWNSTHDRLASYFKFANDPDGAIQKIYTDFQLVRDLFFRGELQNPELMDSITSTYPDVLHNPAELFAGTEQTVASNGLVFVTDNHAVNEKETWFKSIKKEAESSYGVSVKNMAIYKKTAYGSDLKVSNNQYLLLQLEGNSLTKPSVTFSFSEVLSKKYKIYCVFLPESIESINTKRSSQVTFTLGYISDEKGSTGKISVKPTKMETDSTGITKMLVTEFEFPYAYISSTYLSSSSPIYLKIQNDVTTKNKDPKLTSDLRIDYIILEPVEE